MNDDEFPLACRGSRKVVTLLLEPFRDPAEGRRGRYGGNLCGELFCGYLCGDEEGERELVMEV